MIDELAFWLASLRIGNYLWFLKRLSANDTQANGSHQAGPYIPKEFLFRAFPSLNRPGFKNPDMILESIIYSHQYYQQVRVVWYNNKLHGVTNGRNEARITRWGGESSPLLDPENTGALACFAFGHKDDGTPECQIWVCRHDLEEEFVEACFGPVDPGHCLVAVSPNIPADIDEANSSSCFLDVEDIPQEWFAKFPSGYEIVKLAVSLSPCRELAPDKRLLRRRDCEFSLFKSIEQATIFPRISQGFDNIDDFLGVAQSVLQRRKSRAGLSLELHTREIFLEENFVEGEEFSYQPESESNKKPDFLFPSSAAYANPSFPENKLKMLAVKTTCKDRWRQIINEADRVAVKHLFTLQQGVSEKQFCEMQAANVILVVPEPNIMMFPKVIRPHLVTLESFMADVRLSSL